MHRMSRPLSHLLRHPAAARARTQIHCLKSSASTQVPIPLCQRPAVHEDTVPAVLAWHTATKERLSLIGDAFEQQDLGPSESELKRELDWMLDDTIAAIQYTPGDVWMPCTWRFLEAEAGASARRGSDLASWSLQLRAPVCQLQEWWRLRLEERVPFQYLIATAHWRQHVLAVGPGVLIPRPETEIFTDLVSEALTSNPALADLPWTDLGTGSGAIAIAATEALQQYNKDTRLFAVDLSPVAVAYATANISSAGLSHAVTVLCGSWFDPVVAALAIHQSTAQQPSTPSTSQQNTAAVVHHETLYPPRTDAQDRGGSIQDSSTGTASLESMKSLQSIKSVQDSSTGTASFQSPCNSQQEQQQIPLHQQQCDPSQPPSPTLQADAAASGHRKGRLGGVLSNPPYIPSTTMAAGLQAEVGKHEPWSALDGGQGDGLDSLKAICTGAVDMLVPGGFIALETAGRDQATLVASMLQSMQTADSLPAFSDVRVIDDCFGVPRFVTASRKA